MKSLLKGIGGISLRRGRIAARYRNINILLFAAAFGVMSAMMALTFNGVIGKISHGYAEKYAAASAEALSAHINREIGLLSKAARSGAVIGWMADEGDGEKKRKAYEEMAGIIGELYSVNLYIGLHGSLNEYRIEEGTVDFLPFDKLKENNPVDSWYFDCIGSSEDYIVSIGIDHVLQRKRVWLDYKVTHNGEVLGVICTGLEFSHVAGEIFSKLNDDYMRGLIIDKAGMIHIDSALMDNKIYHFEIHEEPIYSAKLGTDVVSAIMSRLTGEETENGEPAVVELRSGQYRYVAVVPVKNTDWSVVILSGTPVIVGFSLFIPIIITLLVTLALFSIATNAINYRLIFLPLNRLEKSLSVLKEQNAGPIFGAEREDEVGALSKTIQDLFTKANVDALTGIYNRRFMENNLQHIMEFLARSNGLLSVLMLDVDYFKKYNDAYGHEQGDVCLKKIASAISGSITRATDFTARYGGEEFVAVLPNTDCAGAVSVAEKIIENVKAMDIPHENSEAASRVTVSIGVATGQVSYMQKWEEYLKRADDALYESKQAGRDRYTVSA
ncbi:MAG: diguanylate cyclase [Defluviitaleaceae bacterium]|nr:diguanylate cyclase [Defluviitaleaceae bacterium]